MVDTLVANSLVDSLATSFPNLRKNTRVASLDKRTLILVAGKDAVTFLDGLTTNDLASAVRESRAVSTAFLTPQGALEYLCLAFPSAEGVVLECERARLKDFAARLWQARMDCSVSFRWLRELKVASIFPKVFPAVDNALDNARATSTQVIALGGEPINSLGDSLGEGFMFKDPRAPLEAWRLCHSRSDDVARKIGLPTASSADYENYRLSLGVVENSEELAQPRALPFEYGLDALAALSWQKACYVGQEITARMKYRARATKKHALAVRVVNSGVALQRGDKIYSAVAGAGAQTQAGKPSGKLCGEIIYAVGASSSVASDACAGKTTAETTGETMAETIGETTAIALCNLARLREVSQEQGKAVDALSLTIITSANEDSMADNSNALLPNARLLVPSWLAELFSRKSNSPPSSSPPSNSPPLALPPPTLQPLALPLQLSTL